MCGENQDMSVLSAAISHCSPLPGGRLQRTGSRSSRMSIHPCTFPRKNNSLETLDIGRDDDP